MTRALGSGGMGVVYEALDRDRGGSVALKVLRRVDPPALYRFKREFRALAGVSHPNLVTLYELVQHRRDWFVTMELVEGSDFAAHVRGDDGHRVVPSGCGADSATVPLEILRAGRGVRPAQQPRAVLDAAQLGRLRQALPQLVRGVDALHRAGHLHRDIKPSNVRVDPAGRVVLLDFGIVCERGAPDVGGEILGTPGYMSPEQAAGAPLGAASDWYAVGVLLFELLVGGLPFSGDAGAVLEAKRQHEAPALAGAPDVPPDLAALVDRLLAREPAARPDGAEILARLGASCGTDEARLAGADTGVELVGRGAELRALSRAFGAISRGPVLALVRGRSGSGKTALCRSFLADLGDVTVLAGRCYERESVPYKAVDPLIDALARMLAGDRRDDVDTALVAQVARLFPVLQQVSGAGALAGEPRDPHERRQRAFAALRELWHQLAARRPLVVWIDDLQWADADSAALLAEVLRPPEAPGLLLLASVRDGAEEANPVLRGLAGVLPADAVRTIAVGDLDAADATELARRRLGEVAGRDELAAAIAREARGSPYLVRELVELRRRAGEGGAGALGLDQLLRDRIDTLPEPARRLLEVVAVAGRPLSQRAAAAAAAVDLDARSHLVQLSNQHLVRTAGGAADDAVESYHDRVRELIVAGLAPDRLRDRHLRLGEALEASGEADPETLAVHFDAGGAPVRASTYFGRAAELAEDALAFDQAAGLYRRALAGRAPAADRDGRLRLGLAEALANAGRGREAAAEFALAAEHLGPGARTTCDRRAAEQLLMSGHIDDGLRAVGALLEALGERLPSSRLGALASLGWRRARVRARDWRWREAEEPIPEAQRARLDAFRAVGHGLAVVDPIRAADFQARFLLLALDSGERDAVIPALAAEACFLASQGGRRASIAKRLAGEVASLAGDEPLLRAWARTAAGFCAYFGGHFAAAAASFADAERQFADRTVGTSWELNTVRLLRLWSLLRVGSLAEVRESYGDAARNALRRGDRYVATTLRRSCSVIWLAADEPERARRELERASWPAQGFHLQHWYELKARAELALYEGVAAEAWPALAADFDRFDRSLVPRVELVGREATWLRARLQLAAGAPGAIRRAERAAARLRRSRLGYAEVWAGLLEGAATAARGEPARAAALLRAVVPRARLADMHAAAAAATYGAELLGGDGELPAWFAAEGVVAPRRFLGIALPGVA